MSEEALKIVGEISALKLEQGDVVVISFARELSKDGVDRIQAIAKEMFPDHKCLVLDEGITLDVARIVGRGGGGQ